jgi:aquaporin Z
VSVQLKEAESGVLAWIDRDVTGPMRDFQDPSQEWRRLFSELYGTFLLVIVAAGGGMMGQAFANTIIMFMGKVSGAHLNPAVSVAFARAATFRGAACPAASSFS